MNIIRVFPHKTSYTPDDDMAFIGEPPPLFIPPHDEVHVSCVFTWDMEYCEELKYQWEMVTDKPVKLGGPAYNSPCDTFTPGMYVKKGVTYTSRGCNNNCSFCMVPKREGKLRELPIMPGNIIQDNNFLQCSYAHQDKVFEMLKTQKGICFKGGLQCGEFIDSHFIDGISGLSIKELWIACDSDADIPGMQKAVSLLRAAGYSRRKIRCYAMIGDDMERNEARLQAIYAAGALPFAQLYRAALPAEEHKEYSLEWKKFHRMWSRPAAIVAHCERGTDMHDYNT